MAAHVEMHLSINHGVLAFYIVFSQTRRHYEIYEQDKNLTLRISIIGIKLYLYPKIEELYLLIRFLGWVIAVITCAWHHIIGFVVVSGVEFICHIRQCWHEGYMFESRSLQTQQFFASFEHPLNVSLDRFNDHGFVGLLGLGPDWKEDVVALHNLLNIYVIVTVSCVSGISTTKVLSVSCQTVLKC